MRRFSGLLLALMIPLLGIAVAGCASATSSRSDQGQVWGFVSSAKNAQLIVDENKSSVLAVNLSKVVAPEAAWVCVYENVEGKVGDMVGQTRVERGVTENVEVPLRPGTSDKVFVLMHADRGKPKVFEFDQRRKDDSPDRPVFVGGSELVAAVTLRGYGVKAIPGTAQVAVYRQGKIDTTVTVGKIVAPANSWIVAQLRQNGRPGKVLGFAPVPAGTQLDYPLNLTTGSPRQNFFVTLFADSGVAGRFEFDPAAPLSSADQPYFVDGAPVWSEVPVGKKN